MEDFGEPEARPVPAKGDRAYELGDVTEEQGQGLDDLFGQPASARYVFMNAEFTDHMIDWMHRSGFKPEEMVEFIGQAMEAVSIPEMCMTEDGPIPSLVNRGVRDLVTGVAYDVHLLLYQVEDGYVPRTLILEGLPARKRN